MKLLSDCGRSARGFFCRRIALLPLEVARVHIRYDFASKTLPTDLTSKNLFYSNRYNFLNLEKRKYFIPEEDYKLRAAMYDVDPTDPR